MWIEAKARARGELPCSVAEAYKLAADVPQLAGMFPGVASVELDDAPNRYRITLEERSTLGISFTGRYVAEYDNVENELVRWSTAQGNMQSAGTWRFSSLGADRCSVAADMTLRLELPVPRLVQKPVELFASRELSGGLSEQMAAFRAKLT